MIGEVKMVRGQGMPSYRHHDYGNLYIKFDIKFPPSHFAPPEVLAGLERILPPRVEPKVPTDAMAEDVFLEEVDANQQARVSGNGPMSPDDEDDEHPGHE